MTPQVVDRAIRRLGLEPGDARTLVIMGALVGVLMCGYTISKVLRDALFLAEFGAMALPYAYIGVALASAVLVWIEGALARRTSLGDTSRLHQYLAIVIAVALALAYPHARHWTTVALYLWTGSQAMMLLPHFWVLALDVWDSRRGRRVFPLLSGCGLIGGLMGGAIAAWLTPFVKRVGLMWTMCLMLVLAHLLTRAVERHRLRRPRPAEADTSRSRWDIVRRSSYIKIFAAGLAVSVMVGTLVDFQFKAYIQHAYPDPHRLTQFLGEFYFGFNALTLLIQFGASGWLLQRLGLGASTGLQPTAVLLFAVWTAFSAGTWVVIAMRWIQGVVFQTLGKTSVEIYYAAIQPSERRRIKPAIDTLVERWSDALVGVMLVVALRLLHVPLPTIAIVTAALAVVWLVLLLRLDRQYGRAFKSALSHRWVETELPAVSMRLPSARRALLEALQAEDERRIVLALRLSGEAHDPEIGQAVRNCLDHPAPAVRAAALRAMEATRDVGRAGSMERFLEDPSDPVRRAAVSYLITCSAEPMPLARRLLEGDDDALRRFLIEALFERPYEVGGVLTLEWIDARLASESAEERALGALALGATPAPVPPERLRRVLEDPDVEVRRAALRSATRRPGRGLLDALVPCLLVPELRLDAREAVVAVGDAAIPAVRRLLDGERGPEGQVAAARVLAQLASHRALEALLPLSRGTDLRLRQLGLQALSRAHLRRGDPTLPQDVAHRAFLRELREYRVCIEPARALEKRAEPEVRLLGESWRESAEMALERGLSALGCWYEPRPMFGVFERLKSPDLGVAAPAIEYLGHVLPRNVFKPFSRIFELESMAEPEEAERLEHWIEAAWRSGDPWLMACAARASRHLPDPDPERFDPGDAPELVRAEIESLRASLPARHLARRVASARRVEASC